MLTDPLLPLFLRGPKQYRAWPKALAPGRITYEPLSRLLTVGHAGDAHTAAYSVPAVPYRLGTDPAAYQRPEIPAGVPMCVLLIDVDCAAAHRATGGSGAVRADDAWWAGIRSKVDRLDAAHPGAFAYRTRGGARVIYRLPVPHIIRTGADEIAWKRLYLRAVAYLARAFGIIGDPSISDWPRLVRLPHVTRDELFSRAETLGDPRAVGELAVPEDDPRDLEHARRLAERHPGWSPALRILAGNASPTVRAARAPRAVEHRPAVDVGQLGALAVDLGRAIRSYSMRHGLHLALAGACYARGVPLDRGPSLGAAICAASGETDDRPQVWQTTADRFASGQAVTGYGSLTRHWPRVAAVLDAALPADGGAVDVRRALDAREPAPSQSAAEAAGTLRATLADTAPGLRIVRVTEGAGKTQAAIAVLRERALAVGDRERIDSGMKTLYVAPTHAVAAEVAAALAGVRGVYLRGVLAVRRADNTHACDYHVPLARLSSARHAVSAWCEGHGQGRNGAPSPCPRREGCEAIANAEVSLGGAGTPAVKITVHAMLAQGLAWAGTDALVIIDEDPQALEAAALTRAELDAAAGAEHLLARSEAWRAPVLRALAAGLERGALPEGAGALEEVALRGAESLLADGGWCAAVRAAFPVEHDPDGVILPRDLLAEAAVRAAWTRRTVDDGATEWRRRAAWAPRLSRAEHARVFAGGASERAVDASRVHALVARLLAGVVRSAPAGVSGHAERAVAAVEVAPGDGSRRVLRAVMASPAVCAALSRQGPTVLLDATADVEVIRAIAGDERVPVVDLRVADGAPVARRLLYWAGASRKTALDGGLVRWGEGVERYLRAGLAAALDRGGRRVVVFTWKPLADCLRAALAGDVGADPIALQVVADARARGAELAVGHYGDARGRNDWMGCDALVSIGDPRPNLGASRAIAGVLGLAGEHGAIYRRAAAAEVSQVSGRLRAPWRTAPAVHVHVGTVAPASWGAAAEVLELPRGVAEGADVGAVVDAVRVYGSQRLGGAAAGVTDRHVRRMTRAGNALSEACHAPGPVTPSNTYKTAADVRACDTLENKRFAYQTPDAAAQIDAAGGAAVVAALLGVGRATVYHWRSGARPMPEDAARRLAEHLAGLESQRIDAAAPTATEHPPAATGGAPGRFDPPPVEEAPAW